MDIPQILLEIKEEQGRQRAIQEQILEQVKKTNGRVTKLEERVDILEESADISAGVTKIKQKIWTKIWDVSKIIISAGIGAIVATWKTRGKI